jgi:hypothetical protein
MLFSDADFGTALRAEVLAAPAPELPSVRLADVQHVGNLRVRVLERLAQHVGGALHRLQALEQLQHRELERLAPLRTERRVRAGIDRLG